MNQRLLDYSDISADVYSYTEAKGIYWVKITWGGSGMYITSFTVRHSKHEDQKWWVQPPKYPPHWKSPLEFTKTSELWSLLERLCIQAVERYSPELVVTDIDDNFDMKKALDEVWPDTNPP
ncbi:hypothetical protein DYH10_00700 [Candidatus Saccharibacteria bacterium CPR2]|nr:hypothetical protein [Candidatus Saccharibacteria bacterium CPR2]